MSNTYDLETLVEMFTLFTGLDGVTPIDPDTVLLYVRTPDGIITEYTSATTPAVTHTGTGAYNLQLVVDQAGPWIYKFQGTGDVEITNPDVYFQVNQSALIGANAC